MAGFFGLFSKKKEEDSQPKDAFFLDDESAKSMGDTEYMKAPKSIRRTFPAGAGEDHFETTVTVSALKSSTNDSRKDFTPKRVEKQVATSYTPATSFSSASSFGSATPTYSAPQAQAPTESPSVSNEEAQKRRQSDDSMDMFRNMAKKIKR
ncbi:MAG: hypothetical protein LH631_05085 [Alkalinema sp. CAN_BIN05]|nr:hypothetical protein [Alkalinema sp. CAN_BIN05]